MANRRLSGHSKRSTAGCDTALSTTCHQTFPQRGPPRPSAFILTAISSGLSSWLARFLIKPMLQRDRKGTILFITVLHPGSQHTPWLCLIILCWMNEWMKILQRRWHLNQSLEGLRWNMPRAGERKSKKQTHVQGMQRSSNLYPSFLCKWTQQWAGRKR